MNNKDLQQRTIVPLKSLYLDPNNYRFIDESQYTPVPAIEITTEQVQKRTLLFIRGEKNRNIQDLLKSFRANGYLEVDQIQVEQLNENSYRVLEGNRRIATLQTLWNDFQDGYEIGNLSPNIFDAVPVTIVTQRKPGEHEMITALKHISGNKKWPTLNQAQLLNDLIYKHKWSEKQVIESIGITLHKLRRDLRTIAIIDEYKKSDYADQFQTNMFNIFREVISSTAIKWWLGWDDHDFSSTNLNNAERLFSWLSELEEEKEDQDGNVTFYRKDKIITQGDQIRTLASFIEDDVALKFMEETRSITQAYGISTMVANEKYKNVLRIIEQQIDEAKLLAKHSDTDDKNKILSIRQEIDGILVSLGELEKITSITANSKYLYRFKNLQLQNITLKQYKSFKQNIKIGPFNRINIFAGTNNVGKTSLLEAIYILCHLNDFGGLFQVYQKRGKFIDGIPSEWFNRILPSLLSINGTFDERPCSINIKKEKEGFDNESKANYLTTIHIKASHRTEEFITKIRIYPGSNKFAPFYKETVKLCNTVFSNPFSFMNRSTLEYFYSIASDKGATGKIIEFMNQQVDSKIQNIEKSGTGDNFRFNVVYQGSERPIDLTEFGDGIQRVFHISLMISAAENGVICIDEIENAIHHSLLIKFTEFIQKIAHEYNVQVFVSTHSSECIKAFFKNNYKNEEITGFRLVKNKEGIIVQKAIGKKFQIQIEQFSLDLRG